MLDTIEPRPGSGTRVFDGEVGCRVVLLDLLFAGDGVRPKAVRIELRGLRGAGEDAVVSFAAGWGCYVSRRLRLCGRSLSQTYRTSAYLRFHFALAVDLHCAGQLGARMLSRLLCRLLWKLEQLLRDLWNETWPLVWMESSTELCLDSWMDRLTNAHLLWWQRV